MAQVAIQRAPASWRQNGKAAVRGMDPYLPEKAAAEWSNGGNSLTYAIQLAHLMGCGQMFAIGFTLASGSPYFFARQNPATRKPSRYQEEIPLAWCRWFEKRFPGRVLLDPTFDGPVYSVFRKATSDARSKPPPGTDLPSIADNNQSRTVGMPLRSSMFDVIESSASGREEAGNDYDEGLAEMHGLNPFTQMASNPAVSGKQQRFMAMCAHSPGKARGKCPSQSVAEEFSHKP